MPRPKTILQIPLPKAWSTQFKSTVLHVIALAQYALIYSRSWAADGSNQRVRLRAECDRLEQEAALLREEIRIKDLRMTQIEPPRRPHYPPSARMAILELRTVRCWSLEQTAQTFLLTAETISSWVRRKDETGAAALVQIAQPVNRYPDFTRYLVQRLKVLCPSMGKLKLAQVLCRAGLHLGATTVGRILKEGPLQRPGDEPTTSESATEDVQAEKSAAGTPPRVVTAKQINHVWHVDLTVIPIDSGFWVPWLPFSLPQCWPFCWWIAVVVDHFSRRALGVGTFSQQPTSAAVRAFLGRTIQAVGAKPKYLICDSGPQFDNDGFRDWCDDKNVQPRYGAVGRHGSIAVVERFILTLKTYRLGWSKIVPWLRQEFRRELTSFFDWYNEHRPHTTLKGCTPNEVYYRRFTDNRRPRFEPRSNWPRGGPCAKPRSLVKGQPGAMVDLQVEFHAGRRQLPIVKLRRAA
jgi:putative transposase